MSIYVVRDMNALDLPRGQSLKNTVSGEVSRHGDVIDCRPLPTAR